MNEENQLGRRVLELRKGLKMTQGSLAEKIGVSTNAISQFEKGGLQPSSETLAKLSEVLQAELHIGKFPIKGTEGNIEVQILAGNQYNRLKWDYLRRNESDKPDKEDEAAYALSNTSYAYESLSLPPSILRPGLTRAFPMPGNNMEPSFGEGDLIIATQLRKVDWNAFPQESSQSDVIDTFPMCVVEVRNKRERSIEFGRCCIDKLGESLRCFSDNRKFYPKPISIKDITAIWEFNSFLSQRPLNPAQQLVYRVDKAERELKEFKDEAKRYPRLKMLLRQMILELGTSIGQLGWDFSDYLSNDKVRELYQLEVGVIGSGDAVNEYADKLFRIIQPLITELAPTVEDDRKKREALEEERFKNTPGQPPYLSGPLPGPR